MSLRMSVVVPTYRGAASLPELVERTRDALGNIPHEIIIVNDASPDDTWKVVEGLAATHPELVALDLLHNTGQARATLCGLAHARGEFVATMDDDLQQPPEQLPVLLNALLEQPTWDAVVGTWPRDDRWFRNLGSLVHRAVDRLVYRTPRDFRHTSFRVLRRPVVDAMLQHGTVTPVLGPLLRQVTSRVHNVEVDHHDRPYGTSNFRVGQAARTVLNNLLQASSLPLRLLSQFGLVVAAIAILLGLALIARVLAGSPGPPGWTSTALLTTFFGGATLFGLGLLGEYIHLIVDEVRRPPRWAIRQRLGRADQSDDTLATNTSTIRSMSSDASEL